MAFGDDDDIVPSYSKQESLTRADRGKKEELKKQIEEKLGPVDDAVMKKAELKSQVNLRMLREEVAGKNDEEKKRKERNDERSDRTSHAAKTKTLKEREQAETQTAQDRPDVDTMIERQEQEQDVSDEEIPAEPG